MKASCAVLTKAGSNSKYRQICYEPTIVTGTYSIIPEQKTELLFIGLVLGQIQKQKPAVEKIVGIDRKPHRIQLENNYKKINASLKILQSWCSAPPNNPPNLILNKHCQSCQFRQICRKQAEKENNLSLLDRMTPKAIRKYNKRGIFTVQQLSYLFKPRRNRKNQKDPEIVKHSLELQALAIRDQKIYLQEIPNLKRESIELFLDIESIPDQSFYYLMGLLVCEEKNETYHSFWANTINDERAAFQQLIGKLNEYPGAPIYHYGNHETKAIKHLKAKHTTNQIDIESRLVNINSYIYGKIYFPVLSNGLKQIAKFLGFSWSSSNASGLHSIFWRYKFEETNGVEYIDSILTYNMEDCQALKLLADRISDAMEIPDYSSKICFTNQPQVAPTPNGELMHNQLETIIEMAHSKYDKNKISLRDISKNKGDQEKKLRGRTPGVRTHQKIIPKPQKLVEVPRDKICPKVTVPGSQKS